MNYSLLLNWPVALVVSVGLLFMQNAASVPLALDPDDPDFEQKLAKVDPAHRAEAFVPIIALPLVAAAGMGAVGAMDSPATDEFIETQVNPILFHDQVAVGWDSNSWIPPRAAYVPDMGERHQARQKWDDYHARRRNAALNTYVAGLEMGFDMDGDPSVNWSEVESLARQHNPNYQMRYQVSRANPQQAQLNYFGAGRVHSYAARQSDGDPARGAAYIQGW